MSSKRALKDLHKTTTQDSKAEKNRDKSERAADRKPKKVNDRDRNNRSVPDKSQADAENPELAGLDKRQLMERMRWEVAQELGFDEMLKGEFGSVTTAECGKFGALLQKRAKQLLEIRHVPKNKHNKRK